MESEKYRLLSDIHSPSDLKKIDDRDLDELCTEIRNKLIETVSSNGGHLASNLGTVELTVALHKTFNAPDDTIIWDVGHQAYTHKLLTGRFDSFDTLRKEGGLSGFVRPDESIYDSFYEGHAGTSVSQASGVAVANKLKGNSDYAVAVIGDGSFGNGMVYEALNSPSNKGCRLIVILNDNEMSINENVGTVARHLAQIRAKPEYYRFKAKTEKALNYIPFIGKYLSAFLFKVKTELKSLIYKSSFFEDFGFRYIGPIDGHDISTLCEAMNSAKMVNGPVLLHVNTVKGRGYDFAENSPEIFHGISEFNVDTGIADSHGTDYSHEFCKCLEEFAEKDKRICAVTAAMSIGTGLDEFFKKFPKRSFDVGIAEEHALTFCSGLAENGMIPVFAVYSTFFQRCIDQLIHDGALQRRKMIIAVDRAGFVGEDGETHQGMFDVPLLQSIPNLTVYSPASYNELSNCLYRALYKDSNVVVIRYPRGRLPESQLDYEFSGDSVTIGNTEADTAIVTYGRLFFEALEAKQILADKGIDIRIIKLLSIKPINNEALSSAYDSKNVVFFEEGVKTGGTGEVFGSQLIENGFKGRFILHAVENGFVPHASVNSLLKKYKFDSESMAELIIKEFNDER
ncbi:MAG: 1-deoxy-D-xylulose-5-phosphate synthase [Clostridia bacterium]|nr:1-deoxy-D-xylulose-5-phosphate synthase [Clostridia bacterium]